MAWFIAFTFLLTIYPDRNVAASGINLRRLHAVKFRRTPDHLLQIADQLVNTNQAGQWRGFAYDGYGRLQSRTTPEQGATTYSYNLDDTTNIVTDARGAKTIFGYNPRHFVSSVSYDLSNLIPGQSVTPTSNVSFTYDDAGNRKTMSDGMGDVSYVYNSLSQLTSETRTFDELGSYNLDYSYNLVGELSSMTNQWGTAVYYNYDKVGRVTGVNGPGGSPNYASGLSYRAFGAIKGMNYGDTKSLSALYDNRLRPTTWNVAGVLGYNYNYDYFNERTGRVSYAQNIASGGGGTNGAADPTLDRSYEYDQVGRLVISHSGFEARAHVGIETQWTTIDGPYSQGYEFDVWGNVTHKYGWGGEVQGGSAGQNGPDINRTYTNNQVDGFSYDAAGNLTNDLGQTFTYDATGQQATASYGGYSLQQNYDGDGLRVKKYDNGATTYYLRSSVLGGQVVAEIQLAPTGGGSLSREYVYLGGQLLALRSPTKGSLKTYWVHEDPITKSQRVTNSVGSVVSTIELDPWGANTDRSNNDAFQPKKFTSYERDGNGSDEAMFRRSNRWHSRYDQPDPYDGSYHATEPQSLNRYAYVQGDPVNLVDPTGLEAPLTCLIDGMPANCSTAFGLVSSGAGTVAGGPGFYGDVLVVNHEPTFDGGRLYQSLYFFNPQTPDLQGLDLWRAGTDELKKRIKESDPCAEFFGGRDKALKAVEKLKPHMGSLPGATIAAIDGNNVTLDSTRFTGSGTPLSVMRFEKVEGAATYYATKTLNLSGAVFGAFAVGHEFGHKMKSYNKENDKDGGDLRR